MICKKRLWIVFPKSFAFYGCCFAKNIGDDICRVFINNDKQIVLMINKFFQNLKGVISHIFFKT